MFLLLQLKYLVSFSQFIRDLSVVRYMKYMETDRFVQVAPLTAELSFEIRNREDVGKYVFPNAEEENMA